VHPVTQTVSALLAIIVFLWQRNAYSAVKRKRLPVAVKEGWPASKMFGPLAQADAIQTKRNKLRRYRVGARFDTARHYAFGLVGTQRLSVWIYRWARRHHVSLGSG
jgi:hypothetical protein